MPSPLDVFAGHRARTTWDELKPLIPHLVRDRPTIRGVSDRLRTRFPNLISPGPIVVEGLHQFHSLFKFFARRHRYELAILKLLERCIHPTSPPFSRFYPYS